MFRNRQRHLSKTARRIVSLLIQYILKYKSLPQKDRKYVPIMHLNSKKLLDVRQNTGKAIIDTRSSHPRVRAEITR